MRPRRGDHSRGLHVDLTQDFEQESGALAREAVAASADHRATIEQAKGASNQDVKIRDLAQRLLQVSQLGEITHDELRLSVDHVRHDISTSEPA